MTALGHLLFALAALAFGSLCLAEAFVHSPDGHRAVEVFWLTWVGAGMMPVAGVAIWTAPRGQGS